MKRPFTPREWTLLLGFIVMSVIWLLTFREALIAQAQVNRYLSHPTIIAPPGGRP